MSFYIVLENRLGCELDRTFAANEAQIKSAALLLVQACEINPGDTIRVIEAD